MKYLKLDYLYDNGKIYKFYFCVKSKWILGFLFIYFI